MRIYPICIYSIYIHVYIYYAYNIYCIYTCISRFVGPLTPWRGGYLDSYGGEAERLAIFGTLWARCGAELKVMAAIETKLPGYYTSELGETQSWDERLGLITWVIGIVD